MVLVVWRGRRVGQPVVSEVGVVGVSVGVVAVGRRARVPVHTVQPVQDAKG